MLNTPKSQTLASAGTPTIQSGQLDRTVGMQAMLKDLKFIKELNKGVQSMKHYLFPSMLQKQALEPLKQVKGAAKNVIIRYREFNGIKLTVMLPVVNNMIKHACQEQALKLQTQEDSDDQGLVCSFVLCHSQMRSE